MFEWREGIECCVGIIRQTRSIFSATPIRRRRDHLFFSCTYSARIWKLLTGKLLVPHYTSRWQDSLNCLTDSSHGSTALFLLRSVSQAAVHSLWRERNSRRHGQASHDPTTQLVSLIDKQCSFGSPRDDFVTGQMLCNIFFCLNISKLFS